MFTCKYCNVVFDQISDLDYHSCNKSDSEIVDESNSRRLVSKKNKFTCMGCGCTLELSTRIQEHVDSCKKLLSNTDKTMYLFQVRIFMLVCMNNMYEKIIESATGVDVSEAVNDYEENVEEKVPTDLYEYWDNLMVKENALKAESCTKGLPPMIVYKNSSDSFQTEEEEKKQEFEELLEKELVENAQKKERDEQERLEKQCTALEQKRLERIRIEKDLAENKRLKHLKKKRKKQAIAAKALKRKQERLEAAEKRRAEEEEEIRLEEEKRLVKEEKRRVKAEKRILAEEAERLLDEEREKKELEALGSGSDSDSDDDDDTSEEKENYTWVHPDLEKHRQHVLEEGQKIEQEDAEERKRIAETVLNATVEKSINNPRQFFRDLRVINGGKADYSREDLVNKEIELYKTRHDSRMKKADDIEENKEKMTEAESKEFHAKMSLTYHPPKKEVYSRWPGFKENMADDEYQMEVINDFSEGTIRQKVTEGVGFGKYMLKKDIEFLKEDIRVLILELKKIEDKKTFIEVCDEIKRLRFGMLYSMGDTEYIKMSKKHLKNVTKIARKKNGVFTDGSYKVNMAMSSTDLRLIRAQGHCMYPIFGEDMHYLTMCMKGQVYDTFPREYKPYNMEEVIRRCRTHFIAMEGMHKTLKNILVNPHGYPNIVYAKVPDSTEKDPYSFYVLDNITDGKRNWKIDHRLENVCFSIIQRIKPDFIKRFKEIYHDNFFSYTYAKNMFDRESSGVSFELGTLFDSILLLEDPQRFIKFVTATVKKYSTISHTNVDFFNRFDDDGESAYRHKENEFDTGDMRSTLQSIFLRIRKEEVDFIVSDYLVNQVSIKKILG
jgi:hypothetical protein